MDKGIWRIATAKLCGRCDHCGETRIVHVVKYTMNKHGLEKRGLENGLEKR